MSIVVQCTVFAIQFVSIVVQCIVFAVSVARLVHTEAVCLLSYNACLLYLLPD